MIKGNESNSRTQIEKKTFFNINSKCLEKDNKPGSVNMTQTIFQADNHIQVKRYEKIM